MSLPKEGVVYQVSFPHCPGTIVRLVKILTFPALGACPDYIFQCFDPEFRLVESSAFKGAFNIPSFLIGRLSFEEITDEEELAKLDLTPFKVEWKTKAQDWLDHGGPMPPTLRDDEPLPATKQDAEDRLKLLDKKRDFLKAEIARLEAQKAAYPKIENGEK